MITVGSSSTGGTGYLTRIIKAAQQSHQIDVMVELGIHQDTIFNTITHQMKLLENVATTEFSVNIMKEGESK